MQTLQLGISEMQVTRGHDYTIITHGLGSCIGVAIYDPVSQVGGMLHYLLPMSSLHQGEAAKEPYKYGDTGIPLLFQKAYQLGAAKENLKVAIAGGGQFFSHSTLDVGSRNVAIARRLFLKNKVLIAGESVGGNLARTLKLDMQTGVISIRCGGSEQILA